MMDIEEIKKLVNEVVGKYKVFEGEFNSITYYWGGDYEEKTYSYDKDHNIICHVSENEIVGRLRWFLRAVYARFCVVDENLKGYKIADNFLKFLGTSNPKETTKSSYLFRVEGVKCEKLEEEEKKKFNVNIRSRVRLVLLKYKDESEKEYHYPLGKVTFSLKIFNTTNEKNENRDLLVVGGTVLTLAYLGIGKATSRGFGRFYPTRWESKSLEDKLSKLITHVKNGEVEKAFNYFYSHSGFNLENYSKWTRSTIPLAPLPCNDEKNEECIKIVPLKSQKLLEVIKCTNISTLKMYYKKELHKKSIDIHTWVFGFPRAHIGAKGIETGYYYKDDRNVNNTLRRVSLVIISPVKKQTNDYDIAILPFLSLEDFREKIIDLRHKGVGHSKKVVTILPRKNNEAQQSPTPKDDIKDAIEKAIKDYVNNLPKHIENLHTKGHCKLKEVSSENSEERERPR